MQTEEGNYHNPSSAPRTSGGDRYLFTRLFKLISSLFPADINPNIASFVPGHLLPLPSGPLNQTKRNLELLDLNNDRTTARRIFVRSCQAYFHYFRTFVSAARRRPGTIKNWFARIGPPDLLNWLRNRDGGILLTGLHYGHPELGPAVLSGLGFDVSAVVYHSRDPEQEKYRENARSRWNVRTIYHETGARTRRRIRERLQAGELVGVLGDPPGSGSSADSAGLDGLFRNVAALSLWGDHPVLPVTVRGTKKPFDLRLHEPIYPAQNSGNAPSTRSRNMRTSLFRRFRPELRKHPHHWFRFS